MSFEARRRNQDRKDSMKYPGFVRGSYETVDLLDVEWLVVLSVAAMADRY